jgi:hypothetical protein
MRGFSAGEIMIQSLSNQKYINLETYRKDGTGVRTPVWFVENGNNIYVWTEKRSGKAKRIRKNPAIKFAPSNSRGDVLSEWINGKAEFVDPGQDQQLFALYTKKYGFLFRIFRMVGKLQKSERIFLRLTI